VDPSGRFTLVGVMTTVRILGLLITIPTPGYATSSKTNSFTLIYRGGGRSFGHGLAFVRITERPKKNSNFFTNRSALYAVRIEGVGIGVSIDFKSTKDFSTQKETDAFGFEGGGGLIPLGGGVYGISVTNLRLKLPTGDEVDVGGIGLGTPGPDVGGSVTTWELISSKTKGYNDKYLIDKYFREHPEKSQDPGIYGAGDHNRTDDWYGN